MVIQVDHTECGLSKGPPNTESEVWPCFPKDARFPKEAKDALFPKEAKDALFPKEAKDGRLLMVIVYHHLQRRPSCWALRPPLSEGSRASFRKPPEVKLLSESRQR